MCECVSVRVCVLRISLVSVLYDKVQCSCIRLYRTAGNGRKTIKSRARYIQEGNKY